MPNVRVRVRCDPHRSRIVEHYAQLYPSWVKEYRQPVTAASASAGHRGRKAEGGSGVERAAMRKAVLKRRMDIIEQCASRACRGEKIMVRYLLRGVCEGYTFDQLKGQGMPYEREAYYKRRHLFYDLLCRELFEGEGLSEHGK